MSSDTWKGTPLSIQHRKQNFGGAWRLSRLVKHTTSAQVTISRFVGWSPASGSGAERSEPETCFGFWVSLSLCPPPPTFCLSCALSQKSVNLKKIVHEFGKTALQYQRPHLPILLLYIQLLPGTTGQVYSGIEQWTDGESGLRC